MSVAPSSSSPKKPRLALASHAAPPAPSALERLIALESAMMAAPDHIALRHTTLTRGQSLVHYGHALWIDRRRGKPRLLGISGQDNADRTTPFAQWIEGQLSSWARQNRLSTPLCTTLESRRESDNFAYPFTHAYFAPFSPRPERGGILFTRDTPFGEAETAMLDRLSKMAGVTDAALRGRKRARLSGRKRIWFWGSVAAIALLACIPVPITALAPAEIVPSEPLSIAAPIDGVIDQVLVEPGESVAIGKLLFRLDDRTLRHELSVAREAVAVADARLSQAQLSAFSDEPAKRELAVLRAEAELARARERFARDQLSKTEIRASQAGVALLGSPSDWQGRPVATGEAVLRIAEPTRVQLRIDAPLAHGEALQGGARVRLFLDSDPLAPLDARLSRASLTPRAAVDGKMAYEARAEFDESAEADDLPRIGARGVAKIYGGTAPLGYFLIRRPLTIARQWLGV